MFEASKPWNCKSGQACSTYERQHFIRYQMQAGGAPICVLLHFLNHLQLTLMGNLFLEGIDILIDAFGSWTFDDSSPFAEKEEKESWQNFWELHPSLSKSPSPRQETVLVTNLFKRSRKTIADSTNASTTLEMWHASSVSPHDLVEYIEANFKCKNMQVSIRNL